MSHLLPSLTSGRSMLPNCFSSLKTAGTGAPDRLQQDNRGFGEQE